MKFMLFVLPTVPGTLEDREKLRPIGRNTERYQAMLDELREIAQLADDAGFDVMTTTEHHFTRKGTRPQSRRCCSTRISRLAPSGSSSGRSASCCRPGIHSAPPRSWRSSTS
jgi:alkanesulfonate monooxygenase SsuD/methylene tetrahydromethanopterin reductase-like flavin-dependent oxidoreductase (luciferase family)